MSDSYLIDVSASSNPVLMTFPQNMPRNIEELVESSSQYQQNTTKKRKAVMVLGDKVTWVGKAPKDLSQEPQFLLGLLGEGKRAGSMTVIPCAVNFQMQQFIHKQLGTNISLLNANVAEKKLSHFEQQMMVAEEMGTSKSKRKMRAMQTNRVQQENISHANQIQEMFESKKDEMKEKVEEDKEAHKQASRMAKLEVLPAFNPNEQKIPSNIYDIQSIVTSQDLESINIGALFVAVTKKPENLDQVTKKYGQYVNDIILDLIEPLQQKNNTEKTLILKYIVNYKMDQQQVFLDAMSKFASQQKFITQTVESIQSRVKVQENQVVRSILSKFYLATQGTVYHYYQNHFQQNISMNYTKSTILQDKLICHMIVLNLAIFDYTFDPSNLIPLLRITQNKFILYCKQCGCTVGTKNGKMYVTLKTPVKFE